LSGRRTWVYVFNSRRFSHLLAITLPADPAGRYRLAVLLGLLLSLAGDIFLMLPGDRFIPGVAAFLAAHLAYLAAFTSFVPLAASPAAFAVVAAAVVAILAALWRSLPGPMRAPLVVYAIVLGSMVAQAISQWTVLRSAAAGAGAVGAVLFLLSDSTLVTDRFARPLRLAPLFVLGTYYAAQVLIAISLGVAAP
jgi:uncharacterized membrane protein YhhN